MADHRRSELDDRGYGDIPAPDREEIRDDTEEDDGQFEDPEDPDEEEDDVDLGKNVRAAERGTSAASRGFTAEIGSEGGSYGETEVEREHGRRRNAGEATTTSGQPADTLRFDRRRGGEE